LGRKFIL